MDADAGGGKLAEGVRDGVAVAGRSDLRFGMREPQSFKDSNDQLGAKPGLSLAFRAQNRPSPEG